MFKSFFKETRWFLVIITLLSITLAGNIWYFKNDEKTVVEESEEELEGLKLTKLTETLYSLTGTVREKDCELIAPQLPAETPFAIILESPGGNLAEGGCLASHIKLRNVVTIVRDTPVMDENGKVLYQPGLVEHDMNKDAMAGKTVCASACSLLFLGGDVRYLIGDVYLGIHGPRTPDEALSGITKRGIESQSFQVASALLMLLKDLGVEDADIRRLFIQIPGTSMYWLNPLDFENLPGLRVIATHYVNFWGLDGEQIGAGLSK